MRRTFVQLAIIMALSLNIQSCAQEIKDVKHELSHEEMGFVLGEWESFFEVNEYGVLHNQEVQKIMFDTISGHLTRVWKSNSWGESILEYPIEEWSVIKRGDLFLMKLKYGKISFSTKNKVMEKEAKLEFNNRSYSTVLYDLDQLNKNVLKLNGHRFLKSPVE